MARVAAGKVAPSPRPSSTRATSIDTRPPAKPVRTVAPPQISAAGDQRAARAEAIADPAADDLEDQVGIGEGRKHQADLRFAKIEVLAEARRRRADIDPVQVGDEVHQAHRTIEHEYVAWAAAMPFHMRFPRDRPRYERAEILHGRLHAAAGTA